jgi:hypothetical protein
LHADNRKRQVAVTVPERVLERSPRTDQLERFDRLQAGDVLQDEFIKVSANPGQGMGGLCHGDSGGPTLLANTDEAIAIIVFGQNPNCAGVGYSYRLDTADALSFIASFSN